MERTAFLHISDIAFNVNNESLDIKHLLHEGENIMVQVLKDPLGNKGARITTNISIPSRYLVLLPNSTSIGISNRITEEDEIDHLRNVVDVLLKENASEYGVIVRTLAKKAKTEDIEADLLNVMSVWKEIKQQYNLAKPKKPVYKDLPLSLRVLRDLTSENLNRILVDSSTVFNLMLDFSNKYIANKTFILEQYIGKQNLYDLYDLEDEIKKSIDRRISLKSGGYIIFDQTEAMTTIDVNTGSYIGINKPEETIYQTNLEASVAIARQLRLRNLGGIIIIDFIDMNNKEHRNNILKSFEDALSSDPAHHCVMSISSLGLVEMTRKRTRDSLLKILVEDCSSCNGLGFVMSAETVYFEIYREIIRKTKDMDFNKIMVHAHQNVVELSLNEKVTSLKELEKKIGSSICVQTESLFFQDQFEIILI
jgi:ribonuclease G